VLVGLRAILRDEDMSRLRSDYVGVAPPTDKPWWEYLAGWVASLLGCFRRHEIPCDVFSRVRLGARSPVAQRIQL
jgi:hypothetical protein